MQCLKDLKGGLDSIIEYTRQQVIDSIKGHNKWYTCIEKQKNPDGSTTYTIGEEIHILPVGNDEFIRTDRNETPSDNLGNLPTC